MIFMNYCKTYLKILTENCHNFRFKLHTKRFDQIARRPPSRIDVASLNIPSNILFWVILKKFFIGCWKTQVRIGLYSLRKSYA